MTTGTSWPDSPPRSNWRISDQAASDSLILENSRFMFSGLFLGARRDVLRGVRGGDRSAVPCCGPGGPGGPGGGDGVGGRVEQGGDLRLPLADAAADLGDAGADRGHVL